MEQYVCAFRGRRDSYQVPLALAEKGWLDQFITDAYAKRWVRAAARFGPREMRARIDFRSEPGIPLERVHCLWGTTVIEHLRHRTGYEPSATFDKLDRNFSWAAARRATRTRSHLFLYSPYAWEAFTARYSHTPRKVLFQYHPHPNVEQRLLHEDRIKFPNIGESFSGNSGGRLPERLSRRERDAWKYADLILCASQFTRRSLVEKGCDERRCHVVPYGVDPPEANETQLVPLSLNVLFVGSGGQRKGLHHLLIAWRQARLPSTSHLHIVSRVMDQAIRTMLSDTPRISVHRSVSPASLSRLYATSSLFVLPSLCEGFGQVYLEALIHGCPVLGTANSGLPDLGDETDGIFQVRAGDIEALTAKLESLSQLLVGNDAIRARAASRAQQYSWPRFRGALRQILTAS